MATEVVPTQQREATARPNDDILHFQELLEATKTIFPSADYSGTWLDLHGLLTLLRLSHMNKEDKQTSWGKGRPEGLCKFLATLEHEVDKVRKCVATLSLLDSLRHCLCSRQTTQCGVSQALSGHRRRFDQGVAIRPCAGC